jgi:hypothetical protein
VADVKSIEVTPEMIMAGVAELAGWENDCDAKSLLAERIFLAMGNVAEKTPQTNLKVKD